MSKKSRIDRLKSFSKKKKPQKSKHVNKQTSKQKNKKTSETKQKSKEDLTRKTYYINPEVHKKLKLLSIKTGKNVSELVSTALNKYLKDKNV